MPLLNSYVIWNNKGGVGKTTLTFHMATQYAESHSEQKVMVIDLCPQANVSTALVGSNGTSKLFFEGKTISSYLQQVTSRLPMEDPRNFLTRVWDFNKQIPQNLELLCGDILLEHVGRSLDHMREECVTPTYNPWVFITSCVGYFIGDYEVGLPPMQTTVVQGVTNDPTDNNDWVVFIDTNPSFAVYTEMALVAAQKLIIPVNADDFSREAIIAMLDLVYGIAPSTVPANLQVYRARMFCCKAQQFNVRRPLIDLVVNNRATSYYTRSAKAFHAMYQSSVEVLQGVYEKNSTIFVPKPVSPKPFTNFAALYFEDIQDFHTAGVVTLHKGCPLGNLQSKVAVFSYEIPINRAQLVNHQGHLNRLVNRL